MKKIFTLFTLFIVWHYLNAQTFNDPPSTPCDSTPANCFWDLRNPIFNTVYAIDGENMTTVIVYGNGTNPDYHDVAFKDEEDGCINGDGCSGNNENYADTLKLFAYYPKHDYSAATGCKLPVFIYAHAGGFSDCSRLTSESAAATFCRYMAGFGFVVYAIEYRSGRLLDPKLKQLTPRIFYNSVFQNSASYRAIQDIEGAIRYIIYREGHQGQNGINDPYRIDTSNIFLGGASAGSVAMLGASYFYETSGQAMLNAVFPVKNDVITNVLGNIDINFYLGNDNLNYMRHVRGIANLWGSVNVTKDYFPSGGAPHPKDFFSGLTYKPPVISFCGRLDNVFDYNFQKVYYSPGNMDHSQFNSTSFCLVNGTYQLEASDNTIDMYNVGSYGFYNLVLQPLSIFSEVYLDCQMRHGLDGNDPSCHKCTSDPNNYFLKPNCSLCSYQSNFGVPTANTTDLTYYYIASRVATFFQAIMSGTTSNVTKTKFIECENYRHSCLTDSYDAANCLTACPVQ